MAYILVTNPIDCKINLNHLVWGVLYQTGAEPGRFCMSFRGCTWTIQKKTSMNWVKLPGSAWFRWYWPSQLRLQNTLPIPLNLIWLLSPLAVIMDFLSMTSATEIFTTFVSHFVGDPPQDPHPVSQIYYPWWPWVRHPPSPSLVAIGKMSDHLSSPSL